jgi:hypothetical protein
MKLYSSVKVWDCRRLKKFFNGSVLFIFRYMFRSFDHLQVEMHNTLEDGRTREKLWRKRNKMEPLEILLRRWQSHTFNS